MALIFGVTLLFVALLRVAPGAELPRPLLAAYKDSSASGQHSEHLQHDLSGSTAAGHVAGSSISRTQHNTFVAVNYDPLSDKFKMVPLSRSFVANAAGALLQLQPGGGAAARTGAATAAEAALTRSLRLAYPSENVGWAWYADTFSEEGWFRLEVRMDSDAPFPDLVKARAAGFIEGNIQGDDAYRYWTNYRLNTYPNGIPPDALMTWLERQYDWTRHMIEAAGAGSGWDNGSLVAARRHLHAWQRADGAGAGRSGADGQHVHGLGMDSTSRRFWSYMALVLAQFDGFTHGFWASVDFPARNMTWHELYALNAMGDLHDLNVLFVPSQNEAGAQVSAGSGRPPAEPLALPSHRRSYTPGHGEVGELGYGEFLDCSALIKLPPVDEKQGKHTHKKGKKGHGGGGGPSGDAGDGDEAGAGAGSGAGADNKDRHRGVRDFWASHNTWRPYFQMVRTWKVYDLPWCASGPLVVSSSPGLLHSKDDWYTTDQFVIMETTNGVYNKTLFDLIHHRSALMWQRAQVANFAAQSGEEWVRLFGLHNSGTYNNQWMVLDVDRLEAGHGSDVLWLLEQVPGLTVQEDISKLLLDQRYFASYNVPFFPLIYNITGYPQPPLYDSCPRARIFSREQGDVASVSDMKGLMRLNRYREDPESLGLPNNAIAARYDLLPLPSTKGNWTQRAYGAVDAKIVDLESFRARTTHVICGPTDDDQPPFSWEDEPDVFGTIAHDGCANQYQFGWQAYRPVFYDQHQSEHYTAASGLLPAAVYADR